MTRKETGVCFEVEPDPAREEEAIVRDAEKTRAGEMADAEDRAREVADGVALPLAPDDVEGPEAAAGPAGDDASEIDFDDPEEEREDHGRGLV